MVDWLQVNSTWLVPLSAVVTILTAGGMFLKWLYQHIRSEPGTDFPSSDSRTKETSIIERPTNPQISIDTIKRTAIAVGVFCLVVLLIFAIVMWIRESSETVAKNRIYMKQVDEAYAALEAGSYGDFQARFSSIDPAAKAGFKAQRGMQNAYDYSRSTLKQTIENYELMTSVSAKSRKSTIFFVKAHNKLFLYSVNKDDDEIRVLAAFDYRRYGWQWSPEESRFGFFVQTGVFSKETVFWVVNRDGEYIKRLYSTNSADEFVRWESENTLVVTDGGTEKKITLSEDNNPHNP